MKTNTYENDNNISLNDKVTGTDADDANKTKNYTFQRIKDFLIAQGLGGGSSVDISGKEDTLNKSTSIDADGDSDIKYPSAKAVKEYVDSNTGLALPFKTYATNLRFMSDGSVSDNIILDEFTEKNIIVNPQSTGVYEFTSSTATFSSNKTYIPPFGYQGSTTNSGVIRLPLFSTNSIVGYFWVQRIHSSLVRLTITDVNSAAINPYTILVDRELQIEIKVYN